MTRLLGIDLGSFSVKIAEVEATGKSWEILGLYDLPKAPGQNPSEILKEFFEKNGIRAERIAVGVSRVPVFVKVMDFPFSDRRRVDSAVLSELEDVLPFEISDQIVDCQYLGKTDDKKHRYLVGVSPGAPLAKMNAIFDGLPVIPTGFFLSSESLGQLALYQDLSFDKENDVFRLMIDIGYDSTQLSIVKGFRGDPNKAKPGSPDKTCVFEFREVQHGLKSVIEWISESRRIEAEESRQWLMHRAQIKSGSDGDPSRNISDELSDEIKVAFRPIVVEIYQFLQNFRAKSSQNVSRAFLTGGVSQLPGLKEFLSEEVRVPIFHWSIFSGFSTEKISTTQDQERGFAVALALVSRYAIRRPTGFLNFRRSDQARKRVLTTALKKFWVPPVPKQVSLVAAALLVSIFYGWFLTSSIRSEKRLVRNQVIADLKVMDKELGRKAEKAGTQFERINQIFQKEKRIYLQKEKRENTQSVGTQESGPAKIELLLEVSQINLAENVKLDSIDIRNPEEAKANGLSISAKWVMVSQGTTGVDFEVLKKEITSKLEPKGFVFSKWNVVPNDNLTFEATVKANIVQEAKNE
jgi:Tfp pilus assembly PilM family ATPase